MADADSLHESGRWEVERIRGRREQEGYRFQWGQLEGKFASKEGEMFWKAPMIEIVQIVKITHTHIHRRTNTVMGVQTPTHTNMLLHAHAGAYANTHFIYLDS